MPKVTDQYLTDKRNFIIECTGKILKEKPLYLVSMRDIIKKAGFSQGVIYRYYAGLDEIYVDYLNRHTTNIRLEQQIDALLYSEQAESEILSECFSVMGEYIEELMNSIAGKTFFELMVLYAYDIKKRNAIFPKLRLKQSLEYAQQKIIEYVLRNIETGVFHPQVPVQSIIRFTGSFIDGIAQSMVFGTSRDDSHNPEPASDIPEMFQLLAKAVLGFLEE